MSTLIAVLVGAVAITAMMILRHAASRAVTRARLANRNHCADGAHQSCFGGCPRSEANTD